MKKEILKSTGYWFLVNLLPMALYFLLYSLGILVPYEIEPDYAGNFYLFTIDFAVSLAVIFAIGALCRLSKVSYCTILAWAVLSGGLNAIFGGQIFNANQAGLLVTIQHILYLKTGSAKADSLALNLAVTVLSTLILLAVAFIGQKIFDLRLKRRAVS